MACTTCGACCAAFRVDFDQAELAGEPLAWEGGVPRDLVMPLVGRLFRLRGTDAAPPRCVALRGEIGQQVACAIYAQRPGPCREFGPLAGFGIGDPACNRARRRHGLPPLAE